jgi:hypothetical protein
MAREVHRSDLACDLLLILPLRGKDGFYLTGIVTIKQLDGWIDRWMDGRMDR